MALLCGLVALKRYIDQSCPDSNIFCKIFVNVGISAKALNKEAFEEKEKLLGPLLEADWVRSAIALSRTRLDVSGLSDEYLSSVKEDISTVGTTISFIKKSVEEHEDCLKGETQEVWGWLKGSIEAMEGHT